jgi:hypothetical protein
MLNKFKKQNYVKTHNLLTGETAASIEHQMVNTENELQKSGLKIIYFNF